MKVKSWSQRFNGESQVKSNFRKQGLSRKSEHGCGLQGPKDAISVLKVEVHGDALRTLSLLRLRNRL